jgi:hypothetical protein
MNSEDIIRMAETCGIPEFENNESQADNILRFAAFVAAAEREKYNELLMAVEKKFPDQSRHETALRYIREAESKSDCAAARARGEK